MKVFRLLCVAALAAPMLGGCASGFEKFYRPIATPAQIQATRIGTPPQTPKLERGSFPVDDAVSATIQRGYAVIGYSSFNGARGADASALAEGKRVGADLVLVFNPQYTGTRSGAIPITTPTSQTTDYNGTVTSFDGDGLASADVSGTATTYGSSTTSIPFYINRYNFLAVYLIKECQHVGIQLHPLTTTQRQVIGSNAGLAVPNVVDGTPAFLANVLPGDIVTAVDGRPFFWNKATRAYLRAHYGTRVTFTIYRNGKYLTKTLTPTRSCSGTVGS